MQLKEATEIMKMIRNRDHVGLGPLEWTAIDTVLHAIDLLRRARDAGPINPYNEHALLAGEIDAIKD
jgi:hypothetical protein